MNVVRMKSPDQVSRSYFLDLSTTLDLGLLPPDGDPAREEEIDPEDCFTDIEGRIMCWEHEYAASPVEAGKLKAALIHLHQTTDEWETLDSRSSELEGLYSCVFSRYAGVMRPAVARLYDPEGSTDMFCDPVLYIETVEVDVSHRGARVGLSAMNALLTHFESHATLALCKPFPLHRKPPRSAQGTIDPRYFETKLARIPLATAIRALGRYWERAGFKRLGRGPYYAANLKARDVTVRAGMGRHPLGGIHIRRGR